MTRITLADVANELGLSKTTVSRALAGYPDVAEKTRVRVQQAVDELGYVPDRRAQQLRRQRADAIGLVLPTAEARFTDPYFSEFLAGVGHELANHDIDLLVSAGKPGKHEQQVYQRIVSGRRVDGFLIVRTRRDDWRIQFLIQANIPVVAFGRTEMAVQIPHIGVDGKAGITQLVTHLVQQGHRRIAFISAPNGLTLQADRIGGYEAGLELHSLARDERLIASGNLTRVSGYEAARYLLTLDNAPTAIIGANDLTALGAMRAAQERGLVVGNDIAIAGFDGTDAAEHAHPPLTTLYQPVYDIGQQVSQMLLALIQGKPTGPPWPLLTPKLMARASTTGEFPAGFRSRGPFAKEVT
ncbi:MAG: LacI family DNA-binding transcriptional regulator [Anaerolineales bacterium]